jgi:hypothetical protein
MMELILLVALSPAIQAGLLARIESSGRLAHLVQAAPERIELRPQVAPGNPPLLSFRYFEGRDRHRFGKLDLIVDDAGH